MGLRIQVEVEVNGNVKLLKSNRWAKMYLEAGTNETSLCFQLDRSSTYASNKSTIVKWDGDNNWDWSSDEILKTDIESESGILDRLLQLDVKNYNWKGESAREHKMIGFIAQDVQPIFPSLVGSNYNEDLEKDTLTLKYNSFGVLAVGAIKELNDKLEKAIKESNDKFEEALEKLTKKVNALAKKVK